MDEALWAVGRATGIIGLALFTVSVLLGILARSGRPAFGLPRFAVTLVHRNASILATAFIVVHIGTLLFDPYAQLELIDFVVPFLGEYRPFWLGMGTVAFDLLLAVIATGLLRNRIGRRTFKVVHWGTYAMWPIALAHALGTGTDAASPAFIGFAVLCTLAVVAAVVWRLTSRFSRPDIAVPTVRGSSSFTAHTPAATHTIGIRS
ncbi:ferric reductase-like transmembrane domain-containing protein [Microbacterium sp. NPDC076911]|uniref:ferric reductase-like transmembrane domain-containing protein n=1 Tax=Microbacterium sp. NPDC076911 TaxID=3154958 RepID=UPI003426C016